MGCIASLTLERSLVFLFLVSRSSVRLGSDVVDVSQRKGFEAHARSLTSEQHYASNVEEQGGALLRKLQCRASQIHDQHSRNIRVFRACNSNWVSKETLEEEMCQLRCQM